MVYFSHLAALLLLASPPANANDWLPDALLKETTNLQAGRAPVADAAYAALATLAMQGDAKHAQALLQQAFDGLDANSTATSEVQGCAQAVATLWSDYGTQLSDSFKEASTVHLHMLLGMVGKEDVPLQHTSDYLRKATNLLVLGEVLHDAASLQAGAQQISEWIAFTQKNGLSEYAAPNASADAVASLLHGYRGTPPGASHDGIQRALDYFCHTLAASFFTPRGILAGAHSHDASILRSNGAVDAIAQAFGWRDGAPPPIALHQTILLVNRDAKGYHPTTDLRTLARQENKSVHERWGNEPGQDRYTYITADFAAGTSSRSGAADDKNLSIVLRSAQDLTDISVVSDATDSPYGQNHLRGSPAQVQHEGMILSTLQIHPEGAAITAMTTSVLLPLAARDIALGGRTMRHDRVFQLPLAPQAVITVHEGNSAVAVRVLFAEKCARQTADATFKIDTEGLKQHVGRITLYHSSGRLPEKCQPRVALLVVARQVTSEVAMAQLRNDVTQATLSQKTDKGLWHVEAKVAGTSLLVERDLEHDTVVRRQINNAEVQGPAPLEVQGTVINL